MLREHLDGGGQVLLATHSPLLLSLPEAHLFEVSERGITAFQPEELEVLNHWRAALQSPERYLRYL